MLERDNLSRLSEVSTKAPVHGRAFISKELRQMDKVLVIEDEEDIADIIQTVLSGEGFQAIVAHTGEAGINKFKAENPDIVLLDLVLPDMEGFRVFRAIREIRDVPIIMLTGRVRFSDRVAGIELGAEDYLVKPFDVDELVERVRAVLQKSRSEE
jgi:DNA-binding response OmpR family regulator